MKHAHSNSTSILKYAAIALAAVFVVSVTLLFVGLWEKQRSEFPEEQQTPKTLSYNGVEYVLKDNIETFLIMGLDKFEGDVVGEDELRADFLMLLVFDNAEKKYSAVHINRDTMTSVNRLDVSGNKINSVTEQIALAHTRGYSEKVNCRNTSDAVSELLLGVKINHYLSMKMDAVPKLNDLVGGVEVTVLDDFTGVDDTLVKGETVTLMGEHALNYVRTRYGLEDSTNSTRIMEITVPRPMHWPIMALTGEVLMAPSRKPVPAIMVPEVRTVGNALLMATQMASFAGICAFSSLKWLEITMA